MDNESLAPPNYFTCTLGEAAVIRKNGSPPAETVSEMIDLQASLHAGSLAVGFPKPPKSGDLSRWEVETFTFQELRRRSLEASVKLDAAVSALSGERSRRTVALLCPSSPDFLVTWLGLMRAGYSVLLVAPQCRPEAIAQLCRACEVNILICDQIYIELGTSAADAIHNELYVMHIPWQVKSTVVISEDSDPKCCVADGQSSITSASIAYIFHTSGTTTGFPKPIPQTHSAAVGVVPYLPQSKKATFTTTPLYHGGIADCMRAWTASDPIWLFPGHLIPITEANIIDCLSTCENYKNGLYTAPICYFSAVPYILQMMANTESGMFWLKKMDVVGVGGAALPDTVGNTMVDNGINLVSRFGSAECGFLLSSYRNFAQDSEWQYLRHSVHTVGVHFEEQHDDSGLFEMIVSSEWPCRAKQNRENGDFATGDLFLPHKEIPNAWKYVGRGDSQLTLSTGKKVDPAPIEDAISAACGNVSDVVIVGNGRQMLGALVFVNPTIYLDESHDQLWTEVERAIEEQNSMIPAYARIHRNMVTLLQQTELEKSSKGTLNRKAAETRFSVEIDSLYERQDVSATGSADRESVPPLDLVMNIVRQVIGRAIGKDDDFYNAGVDSLGAAQIRGKLQNTALCNGYELPFNVVYDSINCEGLAQFVSGKEPSRPSTPRKDADEQNMMKMLHDFTSNEVNPCTSPQYQDRKLCKGKVVLLTGATGALGGHILARLLSSAEVTKVYCLVRAPTDGIAEQRIQRNLSTRKLQPPGPKKLVCLSSVLEEPHLGLQPSTYDQLIEVVTSIIHAAWPVNFTLPLSSFRSSLTGLENLLTLTTETSCFATMTFCSSIASVSAAIPKIPNDNEVLEVISAAPSDSSPLGYSQSKWVAEAMCANIAKTMLHSGGGRIKVIRIGQLCGDSELGIWNMTEAYPLILSTAWQLHALPALPDTCDWLPVDVAAAAIVDIAHSASMNSTPIEVFHVLNDMKGPKFVEVLQWMQEISLQDFQIIQPDDWLKRLNDLSNHRAKPLVGLWTSAFQKQQEEGTRSGMADIPEIRYSTRKSKERSKTMSNVQPLGRDIMIKIWSWLGREMDGMGNDKELSDGRMTNRGKTVQLP